MPCIERIGRVVEMERKGAQEISVEWQIKRFWALRKGREDYYRSPEFSLGDTRWCLILFPNSVGEDPASGWLGLGLDRSDDGPLGNFRFRVGIQGSSGLEEERNGEYSFLGREDFTLVSDHFCPRHELHVHGSRLMPCGVLTLECRLRRVTTRVVYHPHSSNQVAAAVRTQSSIKQAPVSHDVERVNKKVQQSPPVSAFGAKDRDTKIGDLPVSSSSDVPNVDKNDFQSTSAFFFGQRNKDLKPDDILAPALYTVERVDKNILQSSAAYLFDTTDRDTEIDDLPASGSHDAERVDKNVLQASAACSFDVKDRDTKIDSIPASISCDNNKVDTNVLQSTPDAISFNQNKDLKTDDITDKDMLIEEVKALKEEIKILQKAKGKFIESESEKYKKQVIALQSEKLSIEEGYKRQLEAKNTLLSQFEKAAFDDEAMNKNGNDEVKEEIENKKVKQKSRVKSTKKISLPTRHDDVIHSLKSVLANGIQSDFTLKSGGGKEWIVHRAVLEGRSGHFKALFRGADRDQFGVDDITEVTMDGLLLFLYAGEIRRENVREILAVAHELNLRDLKSLCIECLKEWMCPELVCAALVTPQIESDLKAKALDCYFREPTRVHATEEWKDLKRNHPEIIADLFQELRKRWPPVHNHPQL